MRILPIASGKGGVGKSLFAANLSIALAQAGKKVVLCDLDLGGSNLHLILGHRSIPRGVGTFLNDPDADFEDIIVTTEYSQLRFIPGDAEIPGMANLKAGQKRRLIKHLTALDADYLIVDLGAGTSLNMIDFFLLSGHGIIVTTPNLTATLNAYLFLKNAVFRIIENSFKKHSPAAEHLAALRREGTSLQKIYIPKLLEEIEEIDVESYHTFLKKFEKFYPKMVMNLLNDPKDAEKSSKLRRSCKEYLDINMESLGIMYRDSLQDIALSSSLPIIIYKPEAILSQAIYRIADKILEAEGQDDDGPVDLKALDASYQIAEMEAEVDFNNRINDLDTMLNKDSLTKGDLVETIKNQQFEINQLRKENNLLKAKIVKAINAGYKL